MQKNAFDELLETIVPDEGDRKAIGEVATKYPELRDGWLRQSDYSRKMDGLRRDQEDLRGKAKYADEQARWYSDNWVPDAYGQGMGATKRELEKDAVIGDLQQRISVGGEVTFDELKRFMDEQQVQRGWVSKADVDKTLAEKKAEVDKYLADHVAGMSHLVTETPRLAVRHFKEFGEELDTAGLVRTATEKGYTNLEDAWNAQVSERRAEAAKKEWEQKIAEAKEEGRKEALKSSGMSDAGLPVDHGSPEVSHFQKFLARGSGVGNAEGVPPEIELGKGVAAYAARQFAQRDAEGKAAA